MDEEQVLLYEQEGKVVKLMLNRPSKRNAMNHAIIQGLHDAFDRIAKDDSVSVVVIGGKGEKARLRTGWRAEFLGDFLDAVLDGRYAMQIMGDLEENPLRLIDVGELNAKSVLDVKESDPESGD